MNSKTPRVRTRQRKDDKFQRINAPRVQKLVHGLEIIQTSAKSNRASDAELARLLSPVITALGQRPTGHESASLTPAPVSGKDRRDIRAALRLMQSGNTAQGIKALQNIVCGWVVPDDLSR